MSDILYLPFIVFLILSIVIFINSIKNKNSKNKFYFKMNLFILLLSFLYLFFLKFFYVDTEILLCFLMLFITSLLNIIGIIINIFKKKYYKNEEDINKKLYIIILSITIISVILFLITQIITVVSTDKVKELNYNNNGGIFDGSGVIYSINKNKCTRVYTTPHNLDSLINKEIEFKSYYDDENINGIDYSIKVVNNQIIIYKNNEVVCEPLSEGNLNFRNYVIYRYK